MIEVMKPYDIANNILQLPARATLGQMLQYSNQRRNLVKILKRPKQTVATNYLGSDEKKRRTTAAKCYIRVKGDPVVAILDSGAAVSIITKRLMDKLRLEMDTPSRTVVVTADGTKTRALGQISNLNIFIQDLVIPIRLQVIESKEETLLLGTDWFEKMKAKWDFDKRSLQICHNNRYITIGTTYLADTPPPLPIEESDQEEQDFDDIEYQSEDDLKEQEAYISDILKELFYENLAIFLSDTPQDNFIEPDTGVLTPEQGHEVKKLLHEYQDIFAKSISKEGQTSDLG